MLFLKHKSNECLSNTTGCMGVSRLGRRANQACIQMKLRFSKMQGAGNDFVVLDGVRQRIELALRSGAGWRIGAVELARTRCWSSSARTLRMQISDTAFLMPMALKLNNAATARDVLQSSRMRWD